ncbi:nuclear transition protein 2 [Thomomys bottae]
MDTKMQSPSTTAHSQPTHSSHHCSAGCNQCSCSLHCQSCHRSRSCSPPSCQSPSPSPSPSPPSKTSRQSTHSHLSPARPSHHSGCSRNRKTLEGKVNKRRVIKRSRQGHRTKRRGAGRKHK